MAPIYKGRLECVCHIPPNTEIVTGYAFSLAPVSIQVDSLSQGSPKESLSSLHFFAQTLCLFLPFNLPYHSDLFVKCYSCYRGIHNQCLTAEERSMEVTCFYCTVQSLSKRCSLEFSDSQMYPLPSKIALCFFVFPKQKLPFFSFLHCWFNLAKWKRVP